MSAKYRTVVTTAGAVKLAAAAVPGGKKVNLTVMAVGDGGGSLPEPNASQTKLVNEVWRHTLNKISQDNKKKNYIVAELVIPPEVGGFWARELGLYDDAGTLIAVANMAESYKPELAEGSGRAQTCRMVIILSSIESVELSIDSTTVMATQDYVDDKIAGHEQSRRHPDATLKEKGFVQLSSATDSTSEALAATPKAVKVAYDLANAKYTAQDATTARKGIVQLSSVTNSTSEVLAATPKAVKAAYDLANGKYTAQDATTARKGIVQLSSATDSDSETLAATPKAVKAANDNANGRVPSTRKVNKKALSSDITLSADDVGAMPLAIRGTIDDGKTMASANLTGWWTVNVKNTSTVSDFPKTPDGTPLYGYGYLFVDKAGNTWIQHYYSHRGVNAKRQSWSESSPTPDVSWVVDYTTTYKPTAADVGALPLAGGKMLGDITLKNGGIIFPEEAYQNKAVGRCGTYATTSLSYRWELYAYSRTNNDLRTNIITADVVDISKGNVSGGDRNNTTTTITLHGEIITPFKFTPGNYGNFDARYQAKGSYTPAGQAYTKAESDTRYNLKNTASKAANGWEKDASTGVITQWGSGTYSKNARITFPIAFPNGCTVVVGADVGSGIVGTALGARDKTGFTMYANSSTVSINWIARGY